MGLKVKKTIKKDKIPEIKKICSVLATKKIRIGIFGSDDAEMLMIANVQEFGCDITITNKMMWWLRYHGLYVKDTTTQIHIPERSYVRKTFNEKEGQIISFIKTNLDSLFSFEIDVDTFLNRVGQYSAQLVQQTLTEVDSPALHPWTIKRKNGKDNPLIDSGHLRNSITYKIE